MPAPLSESPELEVSLERDRDGTMAVIINGERRPVPAEITTPADVTAFILQLTGEYAAPPPDDAAPDLAEAPLLDSLDSQGHDAPALSTSEANLVHQPANEARRMATEPRWRWRDLFGRKRPPA